MYKRQGVGRWDISAGQVLKDSIQDEPNLFQAIYYYGLKNYLTVYTGIQLTDNNYTAGLPDAHFPAAFHADRTLSLIHF